MDVSTLAAPFVASDIHDKLAKRFASTEDTWEVERPRRAEVVEDEDPLAPGGGDEAESVRFSHARGEGRLLPHLDRPRDFLKRLLPGAPITSANELLEEQSKDTFCLETIAKLEGAAPISEDLAVADKGDETPSLTIHQRRVARLRRRLSSLQGRHVGSKHSFAIAEDGVLLHVGEAQDGRPTAEYVVPESCRGALMAAAHDCTGHPGRQGTRDALRIGRMWWPGIDADVKKWCLDCKPCALNKLGKRVGEFQTPPKGFEPWQVVCVDIVHLEETPSGFCSAFVFTCRLSRAVRSVPATANHDSEEFLNVITYHLIADGIKPGLLIADHEASLASELCIAYHKAFGINPRWADGHMHTAVGSCERFNSSLRQMARAAYFDTGCLWDVYLPLLVAFYNATIHPATGYSPYYLEHGREPSLPWSLAEVGPDVNAPDLVRRHATGLHLAWDFAYRALSEKEALRREEHNARYQTNVRYVPNQRVMVLQPGRHSKMDMPYVGPFRIVEGPDERDRYCLRDLFVSNINPWFHVSKLKRWPDSAKDQNDIGEEYYIISKILDHRWIRRGDSGRDQAAEQGYYEYLVKFRGYSSKYNLYIKEKDFNLGAQQMLGEYQQEHNINSGGDTGAPASSGSAARGGRSGRGSRGGRGGGGRGRGTGAGRTSAVGADSSTASANEQRDQRRRARELSREARAA